MVTLQIFADYHQVILQDAVAAETAGWDVPWTDEVAARKLAVADSVVVIGTVRNDTVPVELVVAEGPPPADEAVDADLVTQATLAVPSGSLVCCGPTAYLPDAFRLAVEPGLYAVRVAYRGLDTLSADGLDGDDRYWVTLWPVTAEAPPQVIADRRER